MNNLKYFALIISLLLSQLAVSQTLTQSNLPIVVITTEDEIPDEPKIAGTMGIIDNGTSDLNLITDEFTVYDGRIGIETRGNSTQDFEKKTYSIELRTEDDQDQSVNLFDMGAEEDWILHAMVIDKSHLRIPLSFHLFQSMGNYASKWRYVELVLNGEYRGLYLFTERIKRDDDRVDIARLTPNDNAGDELTGGYILRIDWLFDDPEGFNSDYASQDGSPMFFQWYYPKAEDITSQQRNYIQDWMRDFESALFSENYINDKGVRYDQYVDIESFIDFFLINELSKNADGYKLSSYIHKERDSDGGRLHAGPIWDFDQTYGVSLVCSNDDFTGWTYLQNQDGCEDLESMPLWWQRLVDDPMFFTLAQNRWSIYRSDFLSDQALDDWITNHVDLISEPVIRNFELWDNFLGERIWIEPEPVPEDYEDEISVLREWIRNRTSWLDDQLLQQVTSTGSNPAEMSISIYPNPNYGQFIIRGAAGASMRLINLSGQVVHRDQVRSDSQSVELSNIPTGIYIVQLESERVKKSIKVFIE